MQDETQKQVRVKYEQITRQYKKKSPARSVDVCLLCLCCVDRGLCNGHITRPGVSY
jgi:hypothetical protein